MFSRSTRSVAVHSRSPCTRLGCARRASRMTFVERDRRHRRRRGSRSVRESSTWSLPVSGSRTPGRERRERECGERVVVDAWLGGEEHVVTTAVVPLVKRAAHRAAPPRHHAICLLSVGERGSRVGAYEHGYWAGAERPGAWMRERSAGEEGVVGEDLLLVVGGSAGEVQASAVEASR
jgi:hypothetical protein